MNRTTAVSLLFATLFFAATTVLGATVLFPYQGGTGISTTTITNVGNCLKVLSVNPLVYQLGTCGSGGGSFTTTTIAAGGTYATSTNFIFATSTDTNMGLGISCTSATCTFTPIWIGTLADGRIASAVTWNAKANLSDISAPGYITATSTAFIATTTGNWLGTWQSNNPSAFLLNSASSTWAKVANNLSDLANTSTARSNLLGTGTGLQYFNGAGSFVQPSSTNVTEGTNLYYLDSRARSALSVSSPLGYSTSTGAFTCTGCLTAALTSLNGSTSSTQTFGTASGSNWGIGTANGVHTFTFIASSTWAKVANNGSDFQSTSTVRSNLGLGDAALTASSTYLKTANNLSDGTASTMRTNLGLGDAAVLASSTWPKTTRTINTTAPIAGGGDLSADRTLTLQLGGNSTQTCSGSTFVNSMTATGTVSCATPPAGATFWNYVTTTNSAATSSWARASATSITVTDAGCAGNTASIYAPGTVIKWTDNTTMQAMVSASSCATPTTTLTLIGDSFNTNANTSTIKYALQKAWPMTFSYAGTLTTSTDQFGHFPIGQKTHIFGADVYVGTAGVGGLSFSFLNNSSTALFGTLPNISNSSSSLGFAATTSTTVARGTFISVNTSGTSTPVDAYLTLWGFPDFYQFYQ